MLHTSSNLVFACHSAACAPPPAGQGGSKPGGSSGKASRARREAASMIRGSKEVAVSKGGRSFNIQLKRGKTGRAAKWTVTSKKGGNRTRATGIERSYEKAVQKATDNFLSTN